MINKEAIKKETLENGATVVGVAAGAATAIGVAGAATATTGIAGSALAAMGVTMTAVTPVGWIIGGGLIGAAALKYGSKLISKKGELSGVSNTMDNLVKERNDKRLINIGLSLSLDDQSRALKLLENAFDNNDIDQLMFDDFKLSVEAGSLTLIDISSMLEYSLPKETNPLNEVILLMRSGLAMASSDGKVEESEIEAIFKYIHNHIQICKDDFDYLFNLEHELNKDKIMNQFFFFQIASSFHETPEIFDKILLMLETIGKADGTYDLYEKTLFDTAKDIFSMAKEINIYSNNSKNLGLYVSKEVNLILPTEESLDSYFSKGQNAINSFAKGLDIKDVIAIHDSTYFGKADEGFILTPYGIIDHKRGLILYSWIEEVEVLNSNIVINCSKTSSPIIISKLMEPNNFAEYLKQFIKVDGEIKSFTLEKVKTKSIEEKANEKVQRVAEKLVVAEEKLSKLAGLASFTMKSVKSDISNAIETNELSDDVKKKTSSFFSKMTEKVKTFVDDQDKSNLSDVKEWHLAQNGEQLGRFSLKDIKKDFEDKLLTDTGLMVWKDGMSTWVEVLEVEEIKSIFEMNKNVSPPPLPSNPPPLP